MSSKQQQTGELPPVRNWPTYWLVVLERAIADGNYSRADDAQRQLRRLGLEVTIRPVPRAEGRQ